MAVQHCEADDIISDDCPQPAAACSLLTDSALRDEETCRIFPHHHGKQSQNWVGVGEGWGSLIFNIKMVPTSRIIHQMPLAS